MKVAGGIGTELNRLFKGGSIGHIVCQENIVEDETTFAIFFLSKLPQFQPSCLGSGLPVQEAGAVPA